MARDTGIAERLRADGIPTKEVEGWKSRGADTLHAKAFVRHHTAGPSQSPGNLTPSLGICVNGRPDLPGPLCNLYLGYDRVVYVVAAGKANHAGTPDGGSWKGCVGNSDAYGLEIEHPGTSQLPFDMHDLAARACAATIRGRFGPSMVCDHKEWAPSRKIDLASGPGPQAFRDLVADYLEGGGFLMGLTDKEQAQLAEDAAKARQFAFGVHSYFEAFKANGNRVEGLTAPDDVNTPFEWAGWKLADRVQNTRLDVKD